MKTAEFVFIGWNYSMPDLMIIHLCVHTTLNTEFYLFFFRYSLFSAVFSFFWWHLVCVGWFILFKSVSKRFNIGLKFLEFHIIRADICFANEYLNHRKIIDWLKSTALIMLKVFLCAESVLVNDIFLRQPSTSWNLENFFTLLKK